ncbi:MAG: hypothetical protein FWC41_04455, partial [Firmicutes bacterium]|nr:hypothetical protein [Bacillota bacterium]
NNSEITSANATYILRYIDGVETEIGVDVTSSANIDYTQPDIIITGKINNKETSDYKINLSKEIITLSSSNPIKAYSIDGGTKWKAVKSDTFIAGNFQKLLNKDMELWLSDTLPDKATKQPPKGAEIIKFSKINKRPKAPKLSVQYEMVEDTSKTLSQWVLSGKSNSSAEKENLEIGVASTTKKGVDEKGYGKIIVTNGVTMKARKTIYYVRYAPTENGTEYTAGSNPQKIVVLGEQKTPKKNILEVFNSIVKYLFKL